MQVAGHLSGGASLLKRMKLGAAAVDPGIVMIGGATTSLGVIPSTTTSFANAYGLAIDEGVYDATPTAAETGEGLVTVDVRPDLIIQALLNQGATESTALTVLQTTSASATVMTDADVGTPDMDGGMIWCISGGNVGQSRSITAFSAGVSLTITVQFLNTMATGDRYLFTPFNIAGTGTGGADGCGFMTTSTLFTQADNSAAAGSSAEISVVDLLLNDRTNSYVQFKLRDHVHHGNALAS